MDKPVHFYTYFHAGYILKGLALHASLSRACINFRLWVVCLDVTVERVLRALNLKNVELIPITDIERQNPRFAALKPVRDPIEYAWTASPLIPLHLFAKFDALDTLIYVDSDTFFFSSIDPVVSELGTGSILLNLNRSVQGKEFEALYGRYDLSFMIIRNTKNAVRCLRWWKERCYEACPKHADGGPYGDQKYLDDFQFRFPGIVDSGHPGLSVAEWNASRYKITERDGKPCVNDHPVISYHFSGLPTDVPFVEPNELVQYGFPIPEEAIQLLYRPYLSCIMDSQITLDRVASSGISG